MQWWQDSKVVSESEIPNVFLCYTLFIYIDTKKHYGPRDRRSNADRIQLKKEESNSTEICCTSKSCQHIRLELYALRMVLWNFKGLGSVSGLATDFL